jgi:Mce-associated membrane protein
MSKTEALADVEAADLTSGQLTVLSDQAEAEAAEAEQSAAEARARADRLLAERGADTAPRKRLFLRRIAVVAALLGTVALLAAGGFMIKQQQNVQAEDRDRAEFAAAARQVVVTLMSIDFNDPQESVQRIVDNSVDPFRQEFQAAAEDFVKMSKDAKVTTKATATAAAVESMTADSAVVLVSASSTVTNAAGADEAPRSWRLTVDLQRDGDQIKMSKVEFVA